VRHLRKLLPAERLQLSSTSQFYRGHRVSVLMADIGSSPTPAGSFFGTRQCWLLSGLLPGDEAYLYLCSLLFYTLFVALVITLILDLHPKVFDGDSAVAEQSVQPAVS
jgi:hypothetical protein